MTSELCLYLAGILFSFFLQIAVAYLACSLLNRVLSRPGQRFAVWMLFLAASSGYWIALASWHAGVFLFNGAGQAPVAEPNSITASSTPFLVPFSWSRRILVASEALAAAYVAIFLLLIMVFFWRRLRLRLLLRYGQPASSALHQLFETTCRDLGISRCDLMVLPGIASPSTVGWLRPRILLPSVCEEIGPTRRLAHVLYHELAHVARRDYLWAGLSELFCHLLFFHPAAWRAKKSMLLERELACDSSVIEARPDHRADYADSLAYFVRLRMLEAKAAVGLDFAAAASNLGTRVRFILAGPPSLPWWNRASRAAIGLAVMSALAVAAPALTVFLAFTRPLSAAVAPQTQAATARPGLRKLHPSAAGTIPLQEISRIQARDSVGETPAYSLTGSRERGGSQDRGVLNRPWRELDTSVTPPSVSDVVRDAVTILRAPASDHDRDRDRNGRLTH
jgi:beta-lactamase regulating signal transducer with metallopeptidase domain